MNQENTLSLIAHLKAQENPFIDENGIDIPSKGYYVLIPNRKRLEKEKEDYILELKLSHKNQVNSKQWKVKSIEIKNRDNFKCFICNSSNNLEVHHTMYFKDVKLWNYENKFLITLCRNCHQETHDNKKDLLGDVFLHNEYLDTTKQ